MENGPFLMELIKTVVYQYLTTRKFQERSIYLETVSSLHIVQWLKTDRRRDRAAEKGWI